MSKTKILKLVMFVVALVICIGATIYLFPVMKNLSTVEGQVAFKQKVESSGVLGLLSLFALEVAQIFLFIIPGEPIEILAGMCYGALWGTVFIMASAGIISTVIFLELASIEFSTNSFTTDEGLSTTSPAAILLAVCSSNIFILFINYHPTLFF